MIWVNHKAPTPFWRKGHKHSHKELPGKSISSHWTDNDFPAVCLKACLRLRSERIWMTDSQGASVRLPCEQKKTCSFELRMWYSERLSYFPPPLLLAFSLFPPRCHKWTGEEECRPTAEGEEKARDCVCVCTSLCVCVWSNQHSAQGRRSGNQHHKCSTTKLIIFAAFSLPQVHLFLLSTRPLSFFFNEKQSWQLPSRCC